jgi:hypothetical protein
VPWSIYRIASRLLVATMTAAMAFGCPCKTSAVAEQKFVLGNRNSDTFFGLFFRKVFTEAFRRLDVSLEITDYPLPRLASMLDEDEIDGDVSRGGSFGQAHPKAVRVEESLIDARWVLYTAQPSLKISALDDLVRLNLEGSWRRGVLVCEQTLKSLLPLDRVASVTEADQGLNLLLSGRTDFYCDVDVNMEEKLRLPRYRGARQVRELLVLGSSPLYTYLSPRNARLAPPTVGGATRDESRRSCRSNRREALLEAAERPLSSPYTHATGRPHSLQASLARLYVRR